MAKEIKDVLATITINGREYEEIRLMIGKRSVSLNGVYLDYTIYVDECIVEGQLPDTFHDWVST